MPDVTQEPDSSNAGMSDPFQATIRSSRGQGDANAAGKQEHQHPLHSEEQMIEFKCLFLLYPSKGTVRRQFISLRDYCMGFTVEVTLQGVSAMFSRMALSSSRLPLHP